MCIVKQLKRKLMEFEKINLRSIQLAMFYVFRHHECQVFRNQLSDLMVI